MTAPAPVPAASTRSFESLQDLRDAHTELLRRLRSGGFSPEVRRDAAAFVESGRGVGALLDQSHERLEAQRILDHWATLLQRAGSDEVEATLAEFEGRSLAGMPSPYVGLYAFQEKDAPWFHGREQLIAEACTRLATERFLAVIGPSGSGKSSLLLGGILPALREGRTPGSRAWHYLRPFVPGSDPLGALLAAAAEMLPTRIAREALLAAPGSLAAALHEAAPEQPVFVLIDQFEEAFTLCENVTERDAFVGCLVALASDERFSHRVVVTMRSDFTPRVDAYEKLHELFKHELLVKGLEPDQLRAAIEKPAAAVGLRFHDGVVNALVRDVSGEIAALPLLQFTLQRLWKTKQGDRVTMEAYRRLGNAKTALANAAEELYGRLDPAKQETLRRILLRMVRLGDGLEVTSNRVRRGWLEQSGEDPQRIHEVLDALLAEGLVRVTGDPHSPDAQVEVAHEALVRNWKRLMEWMEKDWAALVTRRWLDEKAADWVRLGRGDAGLLDATQLREAEEWRKSADAPKLGFHEALDPLIARSRARLERGRKQRMAIQAAGFVALIVGAILLWRAWQFERRAASFEAEVRSLMPELQKAQDDLRKKDAELRGKEQELANREDQVKAGEEKLAVQQRLVEEKTKELLGLAVKQQQATQIEQSLSPAVLRKAQEDLIKRRGAITVEYFVRDDPGTTDQIKQVIESLGFKVKLRQALAQGVPTNVLSYGKVDLADVRALALKLLELGVKLTTIKPLKGPHAGEPLIQLSGYYSAMQSAPLTVDQVNQVTTLAGAAGVDPNAATAASQPAGRVSIVLADAGQRSFGQIIQRELQDENYDSDSVRVADPGVYIPDTTEVRYFAYPQTKSAAEFIVDLLQRIGVSDARAIYVIPKQDAEKTPGKIEVWFGRQLPSAIFQSRLPPRVYLTTGEAKTAETLKRQLELCGYRVKVESSDAREVSKTQVSYYLASDAEDARKLVETLRQMGTQALDPEPKLVQGPSDARPRRFDVVAAGPLTPSSAGD
jgi:energy-coupling factor transporter ATP-binding protein EcfA2